MIRVVELIATFDGAGAEGQLALLASRLDRRRFEPRAIALTRGGPVGRLLDRGGVPHEVIGKRAKFDPGALLRLAARLRALAPAIVHTHLFTANAYGRVAALMAGVPVLIATEHNPDPYKTARHAAVDRTLARATARITCVSEGTREANLRRGLPPGKLTVIHPGLDLAAVERAAAAAGPPAPLPWRITTACRLDPQKDLPTLLEAVALLRARGRPATLEIAGEGEERARIEAAIRRLGLRDAARLLGQRDDVPRLLAAASCFALPSRFEGLGVALLEAMALGVPVVATDVAGIREAVERGVSGLLVPPADPAALAAALESVLADPERGRALAGAGRARVAERFSAEAMVAAYERLFEEEVARVRDRRRRRG